MLTVEVHHRNLPGDAAARIDDLLVCPQCRHPLGADIFARGAGAPAEVLISLEGQQAAAASCPGCGRALHVVGGILDARVAPAPYHDKETEDDLVARILAWSRTRDFCGLVETFIHETTNLPISTKIRFIDNRIKSLDRGRSFLDILWRLEAGLAAKGAIESDGPHRLGTVLDLGCGVGGQLVACAPHADALIGIDAARAELALARRLMLEHHLEHTATLIAANGEALPLRDASVDTIFIRDVIEHFTDQPGALAEAWRVLRPGGRLLFNSPNRYMLWWPEPHVHLYWMGFLPRALMSPYVKWKAGYAYEGNRLLGLGELRKYLRRLRPRPGARAIEGASPPATERKFFHPRLRRVAPLLMNPRFCNLPVVKWLVPEHNILLIKE